MSKKIIALVVFVAIAGAVPQYATEFQAYLESSQTEDVSIAAISEVDATATRSSGKWRQVTIDADSRGHFVGDFRVNGQRIEGLIDTGATFVAINKTSARKFGLRTSASDFKYSASTANGVVKAAKVTLKRMQLGNITVRDVTAFVLPDQSLTGTLIGMSFLNKLDSFVVANNRLVLRE